MFKIAQEKQSNLPAARTKSKASILNVDERERIAVKGGVELRMDVA
jgi:hypothetical protein